MLEYQNNCLYVNLSHLQKYIGRDVIDIGVHNNEIEEFGKTEIENEYEKLLFLIGAKDSNVVIPIQTIFNSRLFILGLLALDLADISVLGELSPLLEAINFKSNKPILETNKNLVLCHLKEIIYQSFCDINLAIANANKDKNKQSVLDNFICFLEYKLLSDGLVSYMVSGVNLSLLRMEDWREIFTSKNFEKMRRTVEEEISHYYNPEERLNEKRVIDFLTYIFVDTENTTHLKAVIQCFINHYSLTNEYNSKNVNYKNVTDFFSKFITNKWIRSLSMIDTDHYLF